MTGLLFGMLAETPIHVGIGQVGGVVDLPVARDQSTGVPIVPGSGMKGAFRQAAELSTELRDDASFLFGPETAGAEEAAAGSLVFTEAFLVLMPVRTLTESVRLLTAPGALRRAARLARLAGQASAFDQLVDSLASLEGMLRWYRSTYPSPPVVGAGSYDHLSLEERYFRRVPPRKEDWCKVVTALARALPTADRAYWTTRLQTQLAIVDDGALSWFGRNALHVMARNKLDNDTKASEALWYEETVPVDSLFLAAAFHTIGITSDQDRDPREEWADAALEDGAYLRVGGNETVGQGWLALQRVEG